MLKTEAAPRSATHWDATSVFKAPRTAPSRLGASSGLQPNPLASPTALHPAVTDVQRWIVQLRKNGSVRLREPGSGPDAPDFSDADLIDLTRVLEELKSAAAATQARAASVLDASQRQAQARAGVPSAQLGRGVGAQIALARRDSPHRGARHLGLGKALAHEMPHTLSALSAGVLSEWRATLLVRETACLDVEDRRRVDALVCGNPAALEGLGDQKLIARIRTLTQAIDPASQVRRHAKAVAERYVSCRPAPDTMSYLTGLLPVAQGVAVYAALSRAADSLRATGDERGRGQIMADTLVERITGQAKASQVPVEVQLVITDRSLFTGILDCGKNGDSPGFPSGLDGGNRDKEPGGSARATESARLDEPAYFPGYGIVSGQWARNLITAALPGQRPPQDPDPAPDPVASPDAARDTGPGPVPVPVPVPDSDPAAVPVPVTLRRLYLEPSTGELTAMDSKARRFPPGLARLIRTRDQTCRTPWCDAPIRHIDHIQPHAEGGPTTYANGQGLCEACNLAKEAPGWRTNAAGAPDKRHTVRTVTPTGHTYNSSAPPLPGSRLP